MKCVKCGHEHNKKKLTLTIESDLINKAKNKGLNISQFLEDKLMEKLN